jgi:hypothetical protein
MRGWILAGAMLGVWFGLFSFLPCDCFVLPVHAGRAGEFYEIFESDADKSFATYLSWTYSDYRFQDWLGFRFGKLKIPDGLLREFRMGEPFHPEFTFLQPSSGISRDDKQGGMTGIALYGDLPAGFSYQFQYGTSDLASSFARRPFFILEEPPPITGLDPDPSYVGSLQWATPLKGLKLRGSFFDQQMDTDTPSKDAHFRSWLNTGGLRNPFTFSTTRRSAASAEQVIGNLTLTAKYYQNKFDVEFDDVYWTDLTGEGYFGSASYRFTDWFEFGSSYSIYYANSDDTEEQEGVKKGINAAEIWIRDFGLSTQFAINNNWEFKFEGHLLNGLIGWEQVDEEDWLEVDFKMTFKF